MHIGNDFELTPTVRMESQHSIGTPTCHQQQLEPMCAELKAAKAKGNSTRLLSFFCLY